MICSCSKEDTPAISIPQPKNVLFVIVDDMGTDATPGYPIGTTKPNTPTLQSLADEGITYTNVWATPTCTPTRAAMLTGHHGFDTQVLDVGDYISPSEVIIHKYISNQLGGSYSQALIGKWHLGSNTSHPNAMGVDYYAGVISGSVPDYYNWRFNDNGSNSMIQDYTTSKFTDLAIDWIDLQDQPWFLWLAYNAPHTPFHLPPDSLHYQGSLPTDSASIAGNPTPYYHAMIEAVDTELGRLLSSMDAAERDNTLIIFIGDNGTSREGVQGFVAARSKGTLYQGGVTVPLIVSGAGVSRKNQTEASLISATDVFATLAEAMGETSGIPEDSHSFYSTFTSAGSGKRNYSFVDYSTMGAFAIRNATHKYILFDDGTEALYDLSINPLENPNLLNPNQQPISAENAAQLTALKNAADSIQP
jgi:arylsulfatase A-like enzyme